MLNKEYHAMEMDVIESINQAMHIVSKDLALYHLVSGGSYVSREKEKENPYALNYDGYRKECEDFASELKRRSAHLKGLVTEHYTHNAH